MSVGPVVVSHSAKVAEGVVELAGQMAPAGCAIQAAGGTDDGGIGTDATLIAEAIAAADEGDGVLVLVGPGVGRALGPAGHRRAGRRGLRGRVRIAEAPVVEGAVVRPPSRPAHRLQPGGGRPGGPGRGHHGHRSRVDQGRAAVDDRGRRRQYHGRVCCSDPGREAAKIVDAACVRSWLGEVAVRLERSGTS